ncbi:MAG: hypothetical protein JXA54_11075 [Candidatus Heimdallarchaeota archaeon]|nr:hypothetical protein [Candidatus Heimdallarchaeota archaeon]
MEITAYTWYFLISAAIVTFSIMIQALIMFIHYIKQRTLGTLLLTMTYNSIAVGEILNTTGLYYFVFISDTKKHSGYLELCFVLFYGLGYIYLYFFANRHILDDNIFVISQTSVILTALVVSFSVLMIVELSVSPTKLIFYKSFLMEGPNILQYAPTILTGVFIFLPIFLFVHLRIVLGLSKMKRKVDDHIVKKGLDFVLIAIISFFTSSLIASAFIIPNVGNYPILITILQTFRMLALAIGIFFGNLGWIMPKWVINLIKKRTENIIE